MEKTNHGGFSRLIGMWKTIGVVKHDHNKINLTETDCYELVLDEKFILHKADDIMGEERSQTFEMIGGVESGQAKMYYYNSRGESGMMKGSIVANQFSIDGDRLKFRGTIDNEGNTISGKWSQLLDSNEWTEFIDLVLERMQ